MVAEEAATMDPTRSARLSDFRMPRRESRMVRARVNCFSVVAAIWFALRVAGCRQVPAPRWTTPGQPAARG
ncbi:hypothetical protein [Xanthomonas sacchari]|uniref:hypothetical protein n=1 Tax=Xanthomonas sacchari TaxID=56458 RepID=UPI0031C08511|nr:hypothetical protein [Xanthomonas campestris pv. cannae]